MEENKSNIKTRRNGYAVAGFVIAFFNALLGLIFSIMGIRDSKKYNEGGRGLAIAGIIISIIRIILSIVLCILVFAMFATVIDEESDSPFKADITESVQEKIIEKIEDKYGKENIENYLENIDEEKLMEEIDNGNVKLSDLAKMVETAELDTKK